jgi:energy-coupling factor transporter ATP-binding protein EcfA2
MRLELPKAERTGDIVASVRGLRKAYPNEDGSTRVLFDDLDLSIERGQRWGIIGPNGAGKTTLVRCLLGRREPDAGTVTLGTKLSIGYFRQSHEAIDPDLTVVRYLQKIVRKECPDQLLSEQAARNLAGAFLFSGEVAGEGAGPAERGASGRGRPRGADGEREERARARRADQPPRHPVRRAARGRPPEAERTNARTARSSRAR